MVTDKEIIQNANEIIKKFYQDIKNANSIEKLNKEKRLLEEFNDALIFEEFFSDLLDKQTGDLNNYRQYIANYMCQLILFNEGNITIEELVEIIKEYETSEIETLQKDEIENNDKKIDKEVIIDNCDISDFEIDLNGNKIDLNEKELEQKAIKELKPIPTYKISLKENNNKNKK